MSASTACRRSPPGPRTAAPSSRCRWSTREHPERQAGTTSACTACTCTTRGRPACTGRSAKAAAFTITVAEARGRGAAGDRLSRRPAGADPRRHRAAARERARADARLADRRRAAEARRAGSGRRIRWSPTPSSLFLGEVPPQRPPAGGALRRSLRLLLAPARLPGLRGRADRAPQGRDLSGHRGRQAAAGGLLHRRPPAGAAVAALPAGHAGRRAALVLRRDRLPLARGGGGQAALRREAMASCVPDPGRGAAVADQVPARHRPRRRSARTSARTLEHVLAAHAIPRPTSTSSRTSRWTRSTTAARRSTRARRGSGSGSAIRCASSRAASPRPRLPRGSTDVPRLLPRLPRRGRVPPTRTSPDAAARFAAHPAFAGWPLVVLTDEPRRAAASPINFLWTTFTRFEPAADIHAAATAHRPPPLSVHAAHPDRRPHEALVPQGAVRGRGHGGDSDAAVEGVFSQRQGGDGGFGDGASDVRSPKNWEGCGLPAPSLPNPSLPASPPGRRERGAKKTASFPD